MAEHRLIHGGVCCLCGYGMHFPLFTIDGSVVTAELRQTLMQAHVASYV